MHQHITDHCKTSLHSARINHLKNVLFRYLIEFCKNIIKKNKVRDVNDVNLTGKFLPVK